MRSDGSLLSLIIDAPATCQGAITKVLVTLHRASEFARLSDRPLWDFATELSELHRLSLDTSAIRWLVLEGLVEMGIEEPPVLTGRAAGQALPDTRKFQPVRTMSETDGLCFVLTGRGIRMAREITSVLPEYADGGLPPESLNAKPGSAAIQKPTWIAAVRELRAGQALVKRFRTKAPAQEVVLAAFEEDGWPKRIDDPLAPRPFAETKHRLRATIQALNRNHEQAAIRFRADGSGEGIVWEWNEPGAATEDEREKVNPCEESSLTA